MVAYGGLREIKCRNIKYRELQKTRSQSQLCQYKFNVIAYSIG